MLNLFNFSKKENIVVVDIRDGSIGGMVLNLDKKGGSVPEKLFSVRKEIPFQRNFNNKRLFYATAQTLISVSSSLIKFNQKKPDKILCIVGPHLHASQVRIIKSKYGEPTLVTENLLNKLVTQDLAHFEKKQLQLGGETSNAILEHKIMQIKLNGYETSSPIGKLASGIEISVFVSRAPKILINDLRKILIKNLHTTEIDFHSFTFILSDGVRGVSLDKRGFVVVSVEGEITEVSVIRNGSIEDTISFPVGTSIITRLVMDRFNVSYQEAKSYLKMYTSNSGDSGLMLKMTEVMDRARVIWSDLLNSSLKKISYECLLPDTFYLVVEDICRDIFLNFMGRAEVSKLLVMNKSPNIDCLEYRIFANLCKNVSECPDDLHFLVEAVFANKLRKHDFMLHKRFVKSNFIKDNSSLSY